MPPSFAEEQARIEQRIGQALARLVPNAWTTAVLDVSRARAEDGGETLTLSISSPENRREVVGPDDELIAAVRVLSLLFTQHGTPWAGLRYKLARAAAGEHDFRAEFTYPPEQGG